MDVQPKSSRDRVFSILNDNDCPSFVIRQKQSPNSSPPTKLPSISSFSPTLERPHFLRQAQYQRTSSVSSAGSPPLLRFDSTSSKSSSSSMDSSPSPIIPAYNYHDANNAAYESLLRNDLSNVYSPTTITPFMEQQLMITPGTTSQLLTFDAKAGHVIPPAYPVPIAVDAHQLSTPSLSNHTSTASNSSSATQSKTSPSGSNPPNGKKNKYPCPYAQSHNCLATFTTSGHAARHGKKHTGEKGVHCPVCNKAFTRKDNMKQHERTHKNKSNGEETRSKAAITKEAQKIKGHKKTESDVSTSTRRASLVHSPISEVTSLAPTALDTPVNPNEQTFFHDPSPTMVMGPEGTTPIDLSTPSMYPPLSDDTLLPAGTGEKLDPTIPMPPTLIRGFSDLDTLAQVAESFDPYYAPQF